jgi:GWxTD domain-containing protein
MSSPRKFFFFLLLLIVGDVTNFLYSQPQFVNSPKKNQILIEKNILPKGDSIVCFISYRIPYSELIFIKNDNNFECNVRFECEVRRNYKVVNRKSISSKVIAENYENSRDPDKYLEGFVSCILEQDNHILMPNLFISNTDKSIEFDSISIYPKRLIKENFCQPIIVEKVLTNCSDSALFKLNNWGNSIPFSICESVLLVPTLQSTNSKLRYTFEQNNSQILSGQINEYIKDTIKLDKCNDSLFLLKGIKETKTDYFIIKEFSHLLSEGNAKLIIENEDGIKSEFNLVVKWHKKPRVLFNPELAIELIKYIADEFTVKMLLSKSSDDYYNELIKFWDSKLPNRKYKFNSLMEEFYKRADYANSNFSTITKQNGALSDRGKIFILYSKPDKIKRDYSLKNSVAEIWFYINIEKEFVFLDETGLGNYILSN